MKHPADRRLCAAISCDPPQSGTRTPETWKREPGTPEYPLHTATAYRDT